MCRVRLFYQGESWCALGRAEHGASFIYISEEGRAHTHASVCWGARLQDGLRGGGGGLESKSTAEDAVEHEEAEEGHF